MNTALRGRMAVLSACLQDALRGKWSGDSDWYISPRWEWFYRLKAALCLLLDQEPGKGVNVGDHVTVTYTRSGTYGSSDGTVYWFESLVVGRGVFSHWWTTYYSDSN